MFFANDENGFRVHIDEAIKGCTYTCPACNDPVIMKCGDIVAHHFSHKSKKNCDPWYTDKMSAWHRELQNIFPPCSQEIVVWNTEHTGFHIADVLFKNNGCTYVLEFQHSPMSRREFDLRSRFYLDLGYRLFWIFDFCDTDPPKKIMYKDINPDEETVDIVWPSQDRIRFLDNLNIFDYTDDAEQFNIFFHVYTGWGKEYEHSYPDGGTWVTWEYVNPLDRKRLFVEPRSYELEDLREFNAFYYSEDEFFEWLARFAKEIEDESAINQR